MSNLATLAKSFGCSLNGSGDFTPAGVAINSKDVEKDFLFVASQGARSHGLDFLEQAIDRGAGAVLTDRAGNYTIPALIHPNPRIVAGQLAAEIFQTPNTGLFAVTGTNGKTSTVFYLQRLLNALSKDAGLISSAGQIVGSQNLAAELTTPEAPRIHQLLKQMRNLGQQHAAVEVSAQALVRNRVDGLVFDVAGFTNLSRDHLDDFGSMANYLASKARLFTNEFSKLAVINIEDGWGERLYSEVSIPKVGIGHGYEYQMAYQSGHLTISGKASLSVRFDKGELMAKNFAVALVMLLETGITPSQLADAANKVDLQIPGRLQLVSSTRPHVYVDYAHTPAGVEAAVREIAARYPKLTVLLSASGNRDQGKREGMALACQGASRIIVTDQHPRDEDPAAIRLQLLKAARTLAAEVEEVADPAQAIARAVAVSELDSAVLWCGPGALGYREISGVKVPFNALEVARLAVESD